MDYWAPVWKGADDIGVSCVVCQAWLDDDIHSKMPSAKAPMCEECIHSIDATQYVMAVIVLNRNDDDFNLQTAMLKSAGWEPDHPTSCWQDPMTKLQVGETFLDAAKRLARMMTLPEDVTLVKLSEYETIGKTVKVYCVKRPPGWNPAPNIWDASRNEEWIEWAWVSLSQRGNESVVGVYPQRAWWPNTELMDWYGPFGIR